MSEVAIFGIGSIMFTLTTWATLAFGMRRIHEVQMRDLEASDRITEVRSTGLTELHMTVPPADDPESA
jgi:hypothetical protein